MLTLALYGLLAILLIGGLYLIATRLLPAGEQIAPPVRDEPLWTLPAERALIAADVADVRLPVALRGYRFAETDLLLDRLVEELRTRDAEIVRLGGTPPAGAVAEPAAPAEAQGVPVEAVVPAEAEGVPAEADSAPAEADSAPAEADSVPAEVGVPAADRTPARPVPEPATKVARVPRKRTPRTKQADPGGAAGDSASGHRVDWTDPETKPGDRADGDGSDATGGS